MDDPDDPDEHVKERIYINETAFPGLAQLRVMLQAAPVVGGSITARAEASVVSARSWITNSLSQKSRGNWQKSCR